MARLTREGILRAASQLLSEVGHESIALRGVARNLGVTAPALYDHFASKDALLRSIAEDGYLALIEATTVEGGQAIERIRRRALAYVGFAADNPELFRLMFLFRPAAVELVAEDGVAVDNELSAATKAFEQGAADIGVAITDGDLVNRDTTQLAMIMWTSMHGVATVALMAPAIAASVAEDVIDAMLAGLKPW